MSTTIPDKSLSGVSGNCDVDIVSTSPTDCSILASSRLFSQLSEANSRRHFEGVDCAHIDTPLLMRVSLPQPTREDIPRGLREILNAGLLPKIKFERCLDAAADRLSRRQKNPPEGSPPADGWSC